MVRNCSVLKETEKVSADEFIHLEVS